VSFHFYTTLTAEFVPRMVVLHRSLQRSCRDFTLRVFCMDEAASRVIGRLGLPALTTVDARELEASDPALLEIKPTRTAGEYCWTAKASAALYILERHPEVDLLTYVDSDLEFFHDPSPLYEELGDGSILLQPHRFSSPCEAELDGTYNAGFIAFRADANATTVLHWWRERCLEWCFDDRSERGRFADQKYLDQWPRLVPGVRPLSHPGAGLALWNVGTREIHASYDTLSVSGSPVVYYHFSSLRLYRDSRILHPLLRFGPYRSTRDPIPIVWSIYKFPPTDLKLFWDPYIQRLADAVATVRTTDPTAPDGIRRLPVSHLLVAAASRSVRASVRSGRRLMKRARGARLPAGPGS